MRVNIVRCVEICVEKRKEHYQKLHNAESLIPLTQKKKKVQNNLIDVRL